MERGYRNLGYWLLALVPIFVAGFWIPYIAEFPRFDAGITTAVHIHAALLFCFLGLLIVQPLAIRYRAFSLHRILGKTTTILMPLILIFSGAMLWKEYHEHIASGVPAVLARQKEFLSAAQLAFLGIFYWLALSRIRKRDIAGHMRYMICIVLVLLPAGLARTLGYWFNFRQSSSQTVCLGLIDALLIALIVSDRSRNRKTNPQPYSVALLAYLGMEVLWLLLGRPV